MSMHIDISKHLNKDEKDNSQLRGNCGLIKMSQNKLTAVSDEGSRSINDGSVKFSLKFSRKANRTDNINVELFKYGEPLAKLWVLHFLNICWSTCKIQCDWRMMIMKLLFKKNDRTDWTKCRGISLFPSGYKLYSQIIS